MNQANLAMVKSFSMGIYGEQRFGLKELSRTALAVSLPVTGGGIGFVADYFGYPRYNSALLGLACGKALGKKARLGVQFDFNRLHIAGYGNAQSGQMEVGLILCPVEKINIALHFANPFAIPLGHSGIARPAFVYSSGLGIGLSEQVSVSVNCIKEEDKPPNIVPALQYVFAQRFLAVVGIQSQTNSPFGSVGWRWKNLRLDLGAEYHAQLGFTPGLMLSFLHDSDGTEPKSRILNDQGE